MKRIARLRSKLQLKIVKMLTCSLVPDCLWRRYTTCTKVFHRDGVIVATYLKVEGVYRIMERKGI